MKRTILILIIGLVYACLYSCAVIGGGGDTLGELPPPTPEGMVLIPAGEFQMGSEDEDANGNERPVRTVHLDAFYMDKYEVTNAQYKVFVDANPQWQKFHDDGTYLGHWIGTHYPAGKADHPVVDVSWYAAMAYAAWAGKRLPTEAEWEYAARGGLAGKKYPWGNTLTPADANYDGSFGDTTAVGQYAANGYGLYDMAGNVAEWCLDKYDVDFYLVSRQRQNPVSVSDGQSLAWLLENFKHLRGAPVVRGGSWDCFARNLRVTFRAKGNPSDSYYTIGFRCVRGTVTP